MIKQLRGMLANPAFFCKRFKNERLHDDRSCSSSWEKNINSGKNIISEWLSARDTFIVIRVFHDYVFAAQISNVSKSILFADMASYMISANSIFK